jgi:1-acyl-sn-glycerol-3-phosphate acyltransferase
MQIKSSSSVLIMHILGRERQMTYATSLTVCQNGLVIQAQSHLFYTRFWQWYIENSVRGHFSSIRVYTPVLPLKPQPTLWHSTHVSFWDGYLGLQLAKHQRLEFRVMMLEQNLKKYSFLRFVGAFGIDRGNSRGALESLRYAANELKQVLPRALLMFPSGEIGSPHLRPIPFESGVAALANLCAKEQDLAVAALAIRLEYGSEPKPIAYLRLSTPRIVQAGMKTTALSALLQDDLEIAATSLHQDLLEQDTSKYQIILKGSSSIPELWDLFRRRVGITANSEIL